MKSGLAQPVPFSWLSALVRLRQSEEGRARGLHAEAADDRQRHAQTSDALEPHTDSPCLIFKTVAVPFSLSPFRSPIHSINPSKLARDLIRDGG